MEADRSVVEVSTTPLEILERAAAQARARIEVLAGPGEEYETFTAPEGGHIVRISTSGKDHTEFWEAVKQEEEKAMLDRGIQSKGHLIQKKMGGAEKN